VWSVREFWLLLAQIAPNAQSKLRQRLAQLEPADLRDDVNAVMNPDVAAILSSPSGDARTTVEPSGSRIQSSRWFAFGRWKISAF